MATSLSREACLTWLEEHPILVIVAVILSFLKILFIYFKVFFIDYTITVFPIFLLYPSSALHTQPSTIRPLSSCPRVVHISSLSPLFPIPFFISLCLFYAYFLYFFIIMLLLPCTFSSLFLLILSPLKTLHMVSISLILFLF